MGLKRELELDEAAWKALDDLAIYNGQPSDLYLQNLVLDKLYGFMRRSAHLDGAAADLPLKPRRSPIKQSVKNEIFRRDKGVCSLCAAEIPFGGDWHIDHVHRVREGGKNEPRNLRLACAACNMERG